LDGADAVDFRSAGGVVGAGVGVTVVDVVVTTFAVEEVVVDVEEVLPACASRSFCSVRAAWSEVA
jgi:hypothetical protein